MASSRKPDLKASSLADVRAKSLACRLSLSKEFLRGHRATGAGMGSGGGGFGGAKL